MRHSTAGNGARALRSTAQHLSLIHIYNGKVKKMTHSEGLQAAEGMLRYLEEHGASAMDILVLRRLRDEAARRRNECERQSSICLLYTSRCV